MEKVQNNVKVQLVNFSKTFMYQQYTFIVPIYIIQC